jgi:hypothetical protein
MPALLPKKRKNQEVFLDTADGILYLIAKVQNSTPYLAEAFSVITLLL